MNEKACGDKLFCYKTMFYKNIKRKNSCEKNTIKVKNG